MRLIRFARKTDFRGPPSRVTSFLSYELFVPQRTAVAPPFLVPVECDPPSLRVLWRQLDADPPPGSASFPSFSRSRPITTSQAHAALASELLHFTNAVESFNSPETVLNALHDVTMPACKIGVLGALLLPLRWADLSAIEVGKTVFLHKSAPKGWWGEQFEHMQRGPGPAVLLARVALAPYTMTETMQKLEPLGIDRWPFELALKYGMRDILSCPVGGRWLVVYWSRRELSRLTQEQRAFLFLGANFAAIRLQRVIAPFVKRLGKGASLTPRELAVLRLLSSGQRLQEIALHLGLGEETVRSHIKKAQTKLGVRDRTHAVSQALRLHLIA